MARRSSSAYRCANCDILFDWQPTRVGQANYCCVGCAEGGPCCCDYDNLPRPTAEQPTLTSPVGNRPPRPGDQHWAPSDEWAGVLDRLFTCRATPRAWSARGGGVPMPIRCPG